MKIYSTQWNYLAEIERVHLELGTLFSGIYADRQVLKDYKNEEVLNGNAVITIKSSEIAKAVLKDMAEFFNKNPNGVYFVPTQEQGLELAKRNLESNKVWKVDY